MFKVLVLDDNLDILEAVSFVLGKKKMEVVTIHDPALLQSSLQEHSPDLVLMDISLGNDYDGRDLCRQIKQSERGKIPVVLVSGKNYTMQSIEDCKADAMIEKPFQLQELYETVYKFCLQGSAI